MLKLDKHMISRSWSKTNISLWRRFRIHWYKNIYMSPISFSRYKT